MVPVFDWSSQAVNSNVWSTHDELNKVLPAEYNQWYFLKIIIISISLFYKKRNRTG